VTAAPVVDLSGREGRRYLAVRLLRSVAASTVLVAVYFLVPLDHLDDIPLWVSLSVALIALAVFSAYQLRSVIRATYPGIRAVEALAVTAPLFLLLFAASYYVLARASTSNFNVHALSRSDALYFTVTVFATVGFGDIAATSQTARMIVTAQMLLDLVVLGLGIRVFIGAVQHARQQRQPPDETSA
jgi:hypothetical protein